MKFNVLKIDFTSPFHFSNNKPDDYSKSEEVLHSDTLWAAIFKSWSILGKSEWIEEFVKNEVTISSLMPYIIGEGEEISYFFPKPLKISHHKDTESKVDRKKLKKIKYWDKAIFEKWLNNKEPTPEPDEVKGIFWTPNKIDATFLIASVVPRIRKGTTEADPEIFYTERLYLKEKAGYYALITADEEQCSKITFALEYLKDAGLGSDRNIGNGQFEFLWDTLDINCPDAYNFVYNLGVLAPQNQEVFLEMLGEASRYDLIKRGGWISEPYSNLRKKSVYMFKPASVFHKTATQTIGISIDLAPQNLDIKHPVYRVGKSFLLPVMIQNYEN